MVKKKLTLEDVLVPKEEIPYEVPENWCWAKLGSISNIISGGTPRTTVEEYYKDGNVSWITPADLSNYNEKYIYEGRRNITQLGLDNSSAKLLPKDSILLSSRAPIGYVAIAGKPLATNQGFKCFEPSSIYLPRYAYWYLKSATSLIESFGSGTTFKEISGKKAALIPMPIPPLAEQERIVKRIEGLFNKVDKASELVDEARDGFEKRRAAILERAFCGELTKKWREDNGVSDASEELNNIKKNNNRKYQKVENEYLEREIPENWCWTNLGELIELLSDYHSNGSYKVLKEKVELLDEENYAMMIRTTNFEKNNFEDLMKYITKDAYEFMEKSKLFGGEILINKIGNAGSSYYMPHFNRPASLAMNLFMLRLVEEVDSKYIYYHLNTIYSTGDIKKFVRGITTKTIDKKSINSLKIALPPLEEQREIVRIIDSLLENEYEVDDICNMQESINNIKKSILAKAFRGELGSIDLNEESSIELVKDLIK